MWGSGRRASSMVKEVFLTSKEGRGREYGRTARLLNGWMSSNNNDELL